MLSIIMLLSFLIVKVRLKASLIKMKVLILVIFIRIRQRECHHLLLRDVKILILQLLIMIIINELWDFRVNSLVRFLFHIEFNSRSQLLHQDRLMKRITVLCWIQLSVIISLPMSLSICFEKRHWDVINIRLSKRSDF